MSKLKDFLREKNARWEQNVADRRARWAALSRKRKTAFLASYALGAVIIAFGIFTETLITSVFVAFVLSTSGAWFAAPPAGGKKKTEFLVAIFPMLTFYGFLFAGAMFGKFDLDQIAKDQALMADSTPQIAQDAKRFQDDWQKHPDEMIVGQKTMSPPWPLSKNDWVASWLMGKVIQLGAVRVAEPIDMTAAYPIELMLHAEKALVVVDPLVDRHDGKEDDKDRYKTIFFISCVIGQDGNVLFASSGPTGRRTDLTKIPAAAPLLEVCRQAAK